MRSLCLLFVLGVAYVSTLASVQAVAEEAATGTRNESAYQLVDAGQRTRGDSQPLARPQWLAFVNAAESTVIPRPAGTVASTKAATTPGAAPGVAGQAVNGGWVNGCPCSDSCQCIDPAICKAGDCNRNYIVLFTAKWCVHCPRQTAIVEQLAKEGYIVHIVEYDTHKEAADQLRITQLPTTLVFDGGKEVSRYIGLTRAEQIKANVKKRDEQKPAPKPDPYDFSN